MKSLDTAVRDGLLSGNIIPRLFVKGEFGSGTWGFWNDAGDVAVSGVTYYGSGGLVSISATGGVSDLSIPGVTVTLSGIKPEVFATFFGEVWHQKPMALDIGFLSPNSRKLLALPDRAFAGYMDDAKRSGASKKAAKLEIQCEDASWRSTRVFADVRSDGNQRDRLATDTFMRRLAVAAQQTVYRNMPTPPGAKPAGF